jgi:hypothetical protein
MSQVSDEYRHSQTENVSVKTAYASDVLTLAQYWDVWCNRVRMWDLQNWSAENLPYGGSLRAACVVSKPHLCIERRSGCRGCAPVEFFRRRIWHLTSSRFLHRKCQPQGRSSLRTSHSGVCRHVYSHLLSAAYTCCPQWTLVGRFFSTTAHARTLPVLLLTF